MLSRPRPLLLLAAFVVGALLIVACGDSDDSAPETTPTEATTTSEAVTSPDETGGEETGSEQPSGPSDEQQVKAAIEALLVSPDQELVCNEVFTEELLQSAYGDLGGCLDGRAPATLAKAVESVDKLEIDGDEASAVVVPRGGIYDGQELEIEAVKDGDAWRIDLFLSNVPIGP